MKKPILIIIALFAFIEITIAQSPGLMVKKGDKGLYLDHEVMPKEGLYAIGRMYNVHPKFLASYNGFDLNKGLSIGQVIHIPLTDTNFSQKPKKGIIPVYYIVGSSDGLQKVSTFNNKVPVSQLKSWNNLKNDNISAGSKLIVGFLLTSQPPATAAASPATVAANTTAKPEVKEEQKPDVKQTTTTTKPTSQPVATTPVESKEPDNTKSQPVETKAIVAEQPKPQQAVNRQSSEGEGYFKPYFEQQIKATPASKNETVTAGIFKTTSGWQDTKYYLLIDDVATGSIVKVINPDNNKAVYCKVLGEMNGIRQNQGLGIRISNATAAALGINETDKFVVKISY